MSTNDNEGMKLWACQVLLQTEQEPNDVLEYKLRRAARDFLLRYHKSGVGTAHERENIKRVLSKPIQVFYE